MPDRNHDESTHMACTQHSGVESRQTSIVWLLAILIGIHVTSAAWQFVAIMQVKDRLGETATQFVRGEAEDKALRVMFISVDQRLQLLEAKMKEVKP